MANRRSIEEILSSDFRWPRRGDHAFVTSGDPMEDANIDESIHSRLVLMTDGYKRAGDLLVKAAGEDGLARDTLVFPIVFNYRHFLEISLKYLLATYGPAVDVAPNWRSHDLKTLWNLFLEMLDEYGSTNSDQADSIVGEIVLEFAKIDPQSFAYRYPVDKNGRPLPVAQSHLHLPTLADVMEGVSGYFNGCDGYFDSLLGARGY